MLHLILHYYIRELTQQQNAIAQCIKRSLVNGIRNLRILIFYSRSGFYYIVTYYIKIQMKKKSCNYVKIKQHTVITSMRNYTKRPFVM